MLKEIFLELAGKYKNDLKLRETLWEEINKSYSSNSRHYHNFQHLEKLATELDAVKDQIQDWETVLFATFYHDIVYKTSQPDNEEQSAKLAKDRLSQLSFLPDKIEKCVQLILATKSHTRSADNDINFFMDADLSVLGQNWEEYSIYTEQIRKEYSIYPDFLYKPGRKKVLQHFLKMEAIFKTEYFSSRYEKQARENLEKEMEEI